MSTLTHSWAGTGCQEGYALSPMFPACVEICIPTSLNSHLNIGIFLLPPDSKVLLQTNYPKFNSLPSWLCQHAFHLMHLTLSFPLPPNYVFHLLHDSNHYGQQSFIPFKMPGIDPFPSSHASKLLAWSMVLGTMGRRLTGETHKGTFWGDENDMYLD